MRLKVDTLNIKRRRISATHGSYRCHTDTCRARLVLTRGASGGDAGLVRTGNHRHMSPTRCKRNALRSAAASRPKQGLARHKPRTQRVLVRCDWSAGSRTRNEGLPPTSAELEPRLRPATRNAELLVTRSTETVYASATLKQTWQRDANVPPPQCAFECLMLNDSACRIE